MAVENNDQWAQVRILAAVRLARLLALAPVFGFAALVAVLTAAGELPQREALWVMVAVSAAFVPSGWVSPTGWSRRMAEGALLPVAYALTMMGDSSLRHVALPPLLVLAAWGATAVALNRTSGRWAPLLTTSLGVAVRAAGGLGLTGYSPLLVTAVLLSSGLVPGALARRWGSQTGVATALLVPWLPFPQQPWLLGVALGAIVAAHWVPRKGEALEPLAARWVPTAAAAALVAAALAPWGGLPLERLLPGAGGLAGVGAVLALLAAGCLPPALGGAAVLGATCLLGPLQPPPPDGGRFTLTAAAPETQLPAGEGDLYLLDLSLANAAAVPASTPVVEVMIGTSRATLKAGEDTAEWAHQRPDVVAVVQHPLPRRVLWRAHGEGQAAFWGAAGRVEGVVPEGVVPVLRRSAQLPEEVTVTVNAAGPARPTPPRSAPLSSWLGGTALVLAALQLLGGTWRRPVAAVPWTLLAAAGVAARAPVEPLRLLLERHGVDLCLVALLLAWGPAARAWLTHRRIFLAGASLLVPLAVGAAFLHPGGGDEQYHLIVLRSLAQDGDLDLGNNYDLVRHPENRIYVTTKWLHSPILASLLLPGFLFAGRAGALALLALAGASLVAVLARVGRSLGVPSSRVAIAAGFALVSPPLLIFSAQIWTEIPGALAAAAVVVLLLRLSPAWAVAAGIAVLATSLKTRLGLVTFTPLLTGLLPLTGDRRRLLRTLVLLVVAVGAALSLATVIYGHPLGPFRRFVHLLPRDFRQPLTTLGGLLFDRAGGMLFSAPLLAVALAGLVRGWRQGTAAVRGLYLGGLATLLLLLPSHEWYGGGSPPLRYLVPALPVAFLALAALLQGPSPWRQVLLLALPPTLGVWFIFATRPHLAFNPGDGGWWLGDALAARFAADSRALFPSFLVPTDANLWVPVVVAALVGTGAMASWRWPASLRLLGRLVVPLWLLAAAGLVATLSWRTDRVVEIEAAQVLRRGGAPEPPAGTFSRFLYRNGWRVGEGEGVTVPLRLPPRALVHLQVKGEGILLARWEGGEEKTFEGAALEFIQVVLPPPPGGGRQRLHLTNVGDWGNQLVFDRVEVVRR